MDVVYQLPPVTDVNATWDISKMQMGIVLVSAHFKIHYSNILQLRICFFLQNHINFNDTALQRECKDHGISYTRIISIFCESYLFSYQEKKTFTCKYWSWVFLFLYLKLLCIFVTFNKVSSASFSLLLGSQSSTFGMWYFYEPDDEG